MRIRFVATAISVVAACTSGTVPPTAVPRSLTPGDQLTSPSPAAADATMSTLAETARPGVASTPDGPSSPGEIGVPGTAAGDGEVPLLPDPSAEQTLGDTVTLSGIPDLVGDQANLTVLEAIRRAEPDASGAPQYAFLVEIEGLDPETLPYNLRDFALFDDQSFEYQPLHEDQQQPALGFGDLPRGRMVRGWLTFMGPEESEYLELEYAPIMALEPAYIRVLLP